MTQTQKILLGIGIVLVVIAIYRKNKLGYVFINDRPTGLVLPEGTIYN